MILAKFRRNPQARSIAGLYGAIVAQARRASFYTDYGVPDTLDGRFDLIVMHLILVLERIDRAGGGDGRGDGKALGQALFDAFCRDLDANLREMGVGDLAVPKRMRAFGEAFYGRRQAYLASLSAADERAFETAIARNIFAEDGASCGAARLARYARAVRHSLDAQQEGVLSRGEVVFPAPEAFVHAQA
jgi:cytochrome b pre-mRNA-processing protein 3